MHTKFSPGQILMTPGIAGLNLDLSVYLMRHLSGDWGDLVTEDKQENERALEFGWRLFSAYETPEGKIWIITEADRSATTVLLPEEY